MGNAPATPSIAAYFADLGDPRVERTKRHSPRPTSSPRSMNHFRYNCPIYIAHRRTPLRAEAMPATIGDTPAFTTVYTPVN